MTWRMFGCAGMVSLLVALGLLQPRQAAADDDLPEVVEFNRDIRPILSNHCFTCHGPDNNNRKAKLRLDVEKSAHEDRGGYKVIDAGKPAKSELIQRITSKDPEERMPPAKAAKPLTARQIALLERWVEQGGKYQPHWSLIAARRHVPPKLPAGAPAYNAIDQFILARLQQEKLSLSEEADRRTLIRRLSFDLTGLPPTPEEVDLFLGDHTPDAYEKLVDRLLASPHFGERLAMYWLDLVRYADTGGYHSDNHRDVGPYRDYVIQAFNSNKRFDQFTIEQLAGDLLPSPTTEQKIASGYNRLLQTTEEGGAQPKEYTAKYAADRVRNAGSVWLAMTLGCAECHDHKFDPVKTTEFYRFAAFFADLKERPVGRQEQTLLPSAAQSAMLKALDAQIGPLQQAFNATTPELTAAQDKWEETVRKDVKGLPKEIAAIVMLDAAKRNAKQKQDLTKYFRGIAPELKGVREQLGKLQQQKDNVIKGIPSTLVSSAESPRMVRVLPRGNWLDDSGQIVQPGVPEALAPPLVKQGRADRLDLAKWLVAPENPLTARVFVNRLWMLYFGQGLVKTLEDFGSQGAWPAHPELLDWLAVEFRESGWDVKHMVKLMVMSRTYRQTSKVSDVLKQRDPFNTLFARQARFRLDAEIVRDNALAISGLLSRKIGGASVRPYQPAGYWKYLNFPTREWANDKGESQYRRGLYTYWCRTFLHPSLLAFDAPTREECTVERTKSNTPQQALVLLNDPTYVEASRVFAERLMLSAKGTEARIQLAFRLALTRPPSPAEVQVLSKLFAQHMQQYQKDKAGAETLLRVGDRPVTAGLDAVELAAWTSVTRVILNLHETITRE
jgi:hypothetical protein